MLIHPTVLAFTPLLGGMHCQDGSDLFRQHVAPLLEEHCLPCHGTMQAKGGLSLEVGKRPASLIVQGDPSASLLMEMVSGTEPKMPKGGESLSEEEIEILRNWIEAGGSWVEGMVTTKNWWSLKPLGTPQPPTVPLQWQNWVRQPLDAFIINTLHAQGLEPSAEAGRRTLLRRLHFDLVGLPPAPERIEAFLEDGGPDAYAREVEYLLSSPRYGERWARHWLDIVHYADTHGFDKDKPRPNAWPYRDWVIRSLNEDKPWGQFVSEQIAGDALYKDDPDAIVATGMLAAGPWDFVGHVELREGTLDKKKTRNLDRDDVVTNVFSSFQSLTVQCARCHDHKFDPVTQADYYNIQSVFAGVERADREYDTDPLVASRRASLRAEQGELEQAADAAEERLLQAIAGDPRPTSVALRKELQELQAAIPAPDRSGSMGYHSELESVPEVPKWIQVDLGALHEIDRIVVHPCDEVFGSHLGPGFGLPAAFEVSVASTLDGQWMPWGSWNRDAAGVRHGDRPIQFELAEPRTARYVRIQVPVLWERTADYCFALAELEVFSSGENIALEATVTAMDSIEAGQRWGRNFLVDGKSPWSPEMARLEDLDSRWADLRDELESPAEEATRNRSALRREVIHTDLAALPVQERVYAAAAHFSSEGSFSPPPEGAPRPIHRLERGDVLQPREQSIPGAVQILSHTRSPFELRDPTNENDRRAALANWITHPDNPLTWRSIVNRVWHYHFGRGIVDTPNDFGRMGGLPSHPELLDYLATRFRSDGGSLKDLHRQIVLSSTYRQSSTHRPEAASIDDGNRFLWRANRRRLEAEALRDTTLTVAGNLNLEMGGPGFQLFGFEDDHSPRYVYDKVNLDDPGTFRRSIYRFVVRSDPDPWMTAFDCADPSHCTPARSESTTPIQALALLNNPFMLRQAERFAARVRAEHPADPVSHAIRLAWQREPDPVEQRLLTEHADQYGLEAACRVLFNSSEFLYVD
ncbi:MAG: DUF1553 domain-containing protein [Planctomycetota bacterium]|nr:DUF1553 domain-containing protein [Planctomycetota bacterium]